jgi:S-phase kinase-associated protein 1
MAGELFEVFGAGRYMSADAPECPEELKGKTIKLTATDGTVEVLAEVAYLSRKVAAVVASQGPDAAVPLPVSTKLLEKVVEYMTHHLTNPPSDITLPLPTTNLAECGASKFDAGFVKGDKDSLFELMYAALAMGIPGLAYLTSAQVATMTQEKAADAIRKAFGLSNDVAEELEQLTEAYNGALGRKRMRAEEGSLMAAAAVMSGLHLAAEKNGGLANGPAGVDLKSARYMCWRAVVLEDPWQFFQAPFEVKADREVAFAAVKASEGRLLEFVAEELKEDKELVLAAVKASGGSALAYAAQGLRGDRSFVQEALALGGGALAGAADNLKGDRALVLEAAGNGQGSCLKGASDALKSDPTFVQDCVLKDPAALACAGEGLLSDKDFLISVAKINGKALEFMPAKFKADKEVVGAAASSTSAAMPLAHAARRADFQGPKTADMVETDMKANMGGLRHLGVPLNDIPFSSQLGTLGECQKYVMFTALSTITPNMGQGNYIAANAFLDKVPSFGRPERDYIAMSWGTVGGMGMRFKAFGSQDFMNMTPDLLLSINDCSKILNLVTCRMGTPEWMAANLFDEGTRYGMLQPTAGQVKGYAEDAAAWKSSSAPQPQPLSKETSSGRRDEEEVEDLDDPVPAGEKKKSEDLPLGGWAMLARGNQAPPTSSPGMAPFEGARVRITGVTSKDSFTGVVTKIYEEGKCRVSLDGEKKGNALVKTALLEVLA